MPKRIRPFDSSILLFDTYSNDSINKAEEIYSTLKRQGINVLLDDRKRIKRKEKALLSDFLGIPNKIIISKSGISIRDRKLNKETKFNNSCKIINYLKNAN